MVTKTPLCRMWKRKTDCACASKAPAKLLMLDRVQKLPPVLSHGSLSFNICRFLGSVWQNIVWGLAEDSYCFYFQPALFSFSFFTSLKFRADFLGDEGACPPGPAAQGRTAPVGCCSWRSRPLHPPCKDGLGDPTAGSLEPPSKWNILPGALLEVHIAWHLKLNRFELINSIHQRFLVNDFYWKKHDGPVFLYISGESALSVLDVLIGTVWCLGEGKDGEAVKRLSDGCFVCWMADFLPPSQDTMLKWQSSTVRCWWH